MSDTDLLQNKISAITEVMNDFETVIEEYKQLFDIATELLEKDQIVRDSEAQQQIRSLQSTVGERIKETRAVRERLSEVRTELKSYEQSGESASPGPALQTALSTIDFKKYGQEATSERERVKRANKEVLELIESIGLSREALESVESTTLDETPEAPVKDETNISDEAANYCPSCGLDLSQYTTVNQLQFCPQCGSDL